MCFVAEIPRFRLVQQNYRFKEVNLPKGRKYAFYHGWLFNRGSKYIVSVTLSSGPEKNVVKRGESYNSGSYKRGFTRNLKVAAMWTKPYQCDLVL